MNSFEIKLKLAKILDIIKVTDLSRYILNRKYKNNYIRVVNYHYSPEKDKDNFEKQIEWFLKRYENCTFSKFEAFLNGKYEFADKPGIVLTFDDGFKENYEIANPILLDKGATGWYMVSAGLLGVKQHISENGCHDYMTMQDLKDIIKSGGVVACHTFTHHRMSQNDTLETLHREIIEAKYELEQKIECGINIFCWCGGEENTYTQKAAALIRKAGYKYSFMTNSAVILPDTEKLQLDRTNIETSWPISLVKFQVSGLMDLKYRYKRKRVHMLTKF